jgi:hypothetical protein
VPLPRVAFELDHQPGQLLYALDVDPAGLRATRSVFGATLHLPVALVALGREVTYRPALFAGALCWADEPDGLIIHLQPLLFNSAELTVPISGEHLTRLEHRRLGEELRLSIRLWGTAQEIATGVLHNVRGGHYPAHLAVPRERWLAILRDAGFGERRLLELPAPPQGLANDWTAVAERLAAAAGRLAAGEPGVALGEARVALERLTEAVGTELGIPRANASGKNAPLANYVDTIAQEFTRRHADNTDDPFAILSGLFKALFGFCSQPGHISFDASARNDAVLALNVATALYMYLACFPITAESDASS